MTSSKIRKTYHNHDVIVQKPQTQNLKKIYNINYKTFPIFRKFEQLYSLTCFRVKTGQKPFEGLSYLCQKWGFWAI